MFDMNQLVAAMVAQNAPQSAQMFAAQGGGGGGGGGAQQVDLSVNPRGGAYAPMQQTPIGMPQPQPQQPGQPQPGQAGPPGQPQPGQAPQVPQIPPSLQRQVGEANAAMAALEEDMRSGNPIRMGMAQAKRDEVRQRYAQAQANVESWQQGQMQNQAEQQYQQAQQQKAMAAGAMARQAFKLTQDQEFADNIHAQMMGGEDSVKSAQQALEQVYQMKFPEPKASTNINLPADNPYGEAFAKMLGQGFVPRDPEAFLKGDTSAGFKNLKDVSKDEMRAIDSITKADTVIREVNDIRAIVEGAALPTVGLTGGMSRRITDFLSGDVAEGDVGHVTAATPAGVIDHKVGTIKSNIGIQTINDMRSMAASGGALGNVSNFEVKVVQAIRGPLDPNMPKEEFMRSLDDIENSYQRVRFLNENREALEQLAIKDGPKAVRNLLQERFPISRAALEAAEDQSGISGLEAEFEGHPDLIPFDEEEEDGLPPGFQVD